jgi:serine/threonine protein kinase
MGAVYRATDTSLGRQVAIKVLPDAFAADPERLARFEREAKTLAALNHPHIAAIYALEQSAGLNALVMELVEGEDLSQRLARGAIPMGEALPLATQIAEALEAAHEQGIIHRDLKPANIKVRDDGTVKVLDFGLAKLVDQRIASGAGAALENSPTMTSPAMMTGVGVLLGTAAYMSPEQAKGRPADKRSDIWAFGCVLFEMLAGVPSFPGDTLSDVVAAILRDEPDFRRLPRALDGRIRSLLTRSLAKSPRERWQSIGDVRYELEQVIAHPTAALAREQKARRGSSGVAWALVGVLAAVTLTIGVLWLRAHSSANSNLRPVLQLSFEPPEGTEFDRDFALSPDGSRIAVSAKSGSGESALYVRSMHEAVFRRIEGTTAAPRCSGRRTASGSGISTLTPGN